MSLPACHGIRRAGAWSGPASGRIALTYEARFVRRKRLEAEDGTAFLLDLPHAESLNHGDAFELSDGRLIEVLAAPEPLLEITAAAPGELTRLAWHIGNRHTPCQIAPERLLIARDPVLADMLRRLGAGLREITAPFTPEGGAYGHGRTHGHDHGQHGHSHDP